MNLKTIIIVSIIFGFGLGMIGGSILTTNYELPRMLNKSCDAYTEYMIEFKKQSTYRNQFTNGISTNFTFT